MKRSDLIQHLRPGDYADMERQLKSLFYRLLFLPLVQEVEAAREVDLTNTPGALRDALRSGQVQFYRGVFSGEFSAAIGRELRGLGATLDKRSGVYRLPVAETPAWIVSEAAAYERKAKEVHRRLLKVLDEQGERIGDAIEARALNGKRTVGAVEAGFRGAARSLEISPVLTEESRARLAEEYVQGLKPYIKDFAQESIRRLRRSVEKNAEQGYRFDGLVDAIRSRYAVSNTKARFLARQETARFMAKYREVRFGEAGVRRYMWSTSHDERVRSSHKHLDGRVFDYTTPPITDRTSGARNNPGQDFNCRCVDVPVLP